MAKDGLSEAAAKRYAKRVYEAIDAAKAAKTGSSITKTAAIAAIGLQKAGERTFDQLVAGGFLVATNGKVTAPAAKE
jgi:hypothetical protein